MAESSGSRLNLFRRAALRLGALMASYGGGVTLNLLTDADGHWARGSGASSAGPVINDESALRVTTAWACVRTIAETVSSVSGGVFERQENGNAVKVDHEVGNLLFTQPNADMNGVEYLEAGATNLAARGNGYSIIKRKPSGEARTLIPVPAARCEPKRRESDGSIYYQVNDRGRYEPYAQDQIWHWKGFGYTGLVGLSPISFARQALGLALAGEEAQSKLFANGLAPTALVKIPGWLTTDQRKLAEEKLAKLHQGLTNYGKPYLLEGGMELDDGVFAPRDAQFLELRQMQVPEICRLWRISPHMVADLARATNNNIEQLSLEFIMYTMLPYFRRIERKASELFKPADRRKYFVQFNFESLLRADSVARAQLYSILLQNGVFSRNEVRALENRNRVDDEGMDDYTVQSNMTMVQFLEALSKSQGQQGAQSAQAMAQLGEALRGMPAPIFRAGNVINNISEQKAPVFNAGDVINNMPEQKAPVFNAGNVINNIPEQPAPVVNNHVKAYPAESFETIERGKDKEISRITRKNKD